MKYLLLLVLGVFLVSGIHQVRADDDDDTLPMVDNDLGASKEGSRTDAEAVKREEEAIKLDGLNVAQIKELREKSEKFTFQAEVNRMMKLIINSLYRNKEIFLRELISNASDALDKIRLLSLTDPSVLDSNRNLEVKIKADKEGKVLHIIDTGIGMTKQDLVNNLGTIAKSGTADFLSKMQDKEKADGQDVNDMIGQFGVGFYSAFLVADRVVVTTKHNDDKQYIWESDAASFSIVEDPRGNTLERGSQVSLHLKEEALDFLEDDTVKQLIKKYSQFINFPIYMWTSKEVEEEVAVEEEATEKPAKSEDSTDEEEEDVKVEEEEATDSDKPKTKKVKKTVWNWEIMNDSKPIWTRKVSDVTDEEYTEFYKSLTKDTSDPLTHTHFIAEGEVTFKSLLFVPKVQPSESFNKYGTKADNIKLYVRRVFITDEFNDMMPNYLSFIRGVVDSDDLPLNVSRETLQQHKLIKVIKKKLVRKALDMIKKIDKEQYEQFWKEYSTNIKLGIMEDPSNRSRLAKLLRFQSSSTKNKEYTSLSDYVARMKPKQDNIYFIAGPNRAEIEKSPFVERLLSRGYEVLFLVEAVDEYSISALPEFDGKRFQNVAKEGFTLNESEESKARFEELKTEYEPLLKWLNDVALKDKIAKAQLSERLSNSPCALVASMFGWTGNMERLALANAHQKTDDPQRHYYLNQKKTLEINPRHPLMRELLRRVEVDSDDIVAKDMAVLMFNTATLRSGFQLPETADFADSVERMMRQTLGVSLDEQPEQEEFVDEPAAGGEEGGAAADEDEESIDADGGDHDEL
ncbi:endoplasmin [Anopheles arabiensis]|uniref:Heat shock protein 83 n=1 Tax=Anopheles arabiensis TaxID=7173 RepID=A0A182HKU6_ANOAR|nr:endoplasmin [Anopheles arabiensis]XP_040225832.1 endoplasmin [Anopheles coluzzii]XP_321706.6 endoplasmin [Anopheles gambiae]